MTHPEFVKIMAYIGLGIGKPLSADSLSVYFDLLGDLKADVLQLAAKRVLLQHHWATFPTIAAIRQAAVETMRGQVAERPPAEAWRLAWAAVARIDLEQPGSKERAIKGLPTLVIQAMNTFGLAALCSSQDPVTVVRSQFIKIYEQLAAVDRRAALLPASIKNALSDRRASLLPPSIAGVLQAIGQ